MYEYACETHWAYFCLNSMILFNGETVIAYFGVGNTLWYYLNLQAIEAFVLLAQEKFLQSPRIALQLKWSRTINTHGKPGKNIPCDLHMEHLNHEAKNAFIGLGSNITDQSVKRIGQCLGVTDSTSIGQL